jgi:hypothetical protein
MVVALCTLEPFAEAQHVLLKRMGQPITGEVGTVLNLFRTLKRGVHSLRRIS